MLAYRKFSCFNSSRNMRRQSKSIPWFVVAFWLQFGCEELGSKDSGEGSVRERTVTESAVLDIGGIR